jgi:tRNA A-37 threonylcarbamoyl transferase component Bud32
MGELPWRAETEIYGSELASLLPVGMRMPTLYAINDLDDDRAALWMEDVEERDGDWTAGDYSTAARSLGRLAGRLPEERIPPAIPVQRRDLRRYFFGRVVHGTLPTLLADETWSHPLVRDVVDVRLRDDLGALAAAAPALLGRLVGLPHAFAHGDACPQNLLRPRGDTDAVVAIDWTFAGICPVGMDAGQLLAGRAESGELSPGNLPDLFEDIVAAYISGLADEDSPVSAADARFGAIGNLVVRSAFTALPIELLFSNDGGIGELVARRAGYARFLVDLADELLIRR